MKVRKQVVGELEKCYSISGLPFRGEEHILIAAEKVDRCMLFTKKGEYVDTIWDGPGGTMSMVPVPGTEGEFLATHRFYSPNDAKEASIVHVRYADGEWKINKVIDLPFVHRFDLVRGGDDLYLIACCLKTDFEYKEDWRFPGKTLACKVPESWDEPLDPSKLVVLKDQMLKNHGYYKIDDNGIDRCVISCDNGIYLFTPPQRDGEEWTIEELLDKPGSDAMLVDLDEDGERELLVLSPFHGSSLKIYKKKDGRFEEVFSYPEPLEFLHSMWSGKLNGKTYAIIGHRKGKRQLLAISYSEYFGEYVAEVLDRDTGSANVAVFDTDEGPMIVSTNREINEIAFYHVEKE